MSRQNNFDIGYQEIEEAIIYSYEDPTNTFEISNFIIDWYMTESVTNPYIYGNISVVDTYNLIDRFPLIGEEILRLKVKDLFGNVFEKEFWCVKVDSIAPNEQLTALAYKIHFASPESVFAKSRKISKSFYNKTISQIAQLVFESMFTSQKFSSNIDIEDTTGTQNIIIPDMDGIQAMDFLKRRGFSVENKSSNFLFYEDRNGFHFKTHEQLIRDRKDSSIILYHNPNLNISVENRLRAMDMIKSIAFPIRHSLLHEIDAGAMISETIEFDILSKQYIKTPYEYNTLFDQYYHHENKRALFPHTDTFRQEFFGRENIVKDKMIFTDNERPNQNYKDMVGYRNSINYYTNTILCQIEINGRYDLNCGDTVYLHIPTFQNLRDRNENKYTAGLWSIHTINHYMNSENKYNQSILLFRDAYKNG